MQLKRKYREFLLLSIVGAVTLFQCGPSIKQMENQSILPEIDVVQVKEYSQEALKLAQEAKMDAQMLNTKLADLDTRLSQTNEEVSQVSPAKLEELENRLSLLVEAFKELHTKVAAIEVLPQISIKPKKTNKPAVFSPSDPSVMLTSSEYDQYQEALRTFDRRSYSEALKLFKDVVEKYPKGEYTDKAQYWVGECYFGLSDYAKAIAALTIVLDYPNSSKADDAQLKIGLSYLRLGKPDMAQAEFKRLITRYPASEYVPRAQKYLSEIKM